MRSIIRLSSLVLLVAMFTSCSKVILVPEEPLAGSWILTDAAHKDAYGWYPVNTGIERGVFHFYSNGTARYTEGSITMTGTWDIYNSHGGYYDEYGNYYSDNHQSLQVSVADYYGDETINMYFDHVRIYNNRFVGTNYNDHYIERYEFRRY